MRLESANLCLLSWTDKMMVMKNTLCRLFIVVFGLIFPFHALFFDVIKLRNITLLRFKASLLQCHAIYHLFIRHPAISDHDSPTTLSFTAVDLCYFVSALRVEPTSS